MTLGDVLAKLAEFVWDFWPLRIVHEWETGIRLRNGRITRTLAPGLHWFWPVIGEIITEDTLLDVNATELQTVTTSDGVEVTFSLALKYRIVDLAAMYRSIQDHDDTVNNEVCASAAGWIAEMVDGELDGLAEAIYGDVRVRLEEWGVELEGVAMFTLTRAQTLRLLTDGNTD